MTDDAGETPADPLGSFLRSQRRLANLTLRQMAERTKVSNAYLSQIERGLHVPSVRVLRSIARALDVSAEAMLTHAGLLADGPPGDEAEGSAGSKTTTTTTEAAIRADADLNEDQKGALLTVYRSYITHNRRSGDD